MSAPPTDFKKLLADARLPEHSVPICLRGDLVAEFEQWDRELAEADRSPAAGMEDAGPAAGIAERMEALRVQMREHTYQFRVRALPKARYRALKALHEPRKDDDSGEVLEEDRYLDANLDTFGEALLKACLVDPVLDDADWQDLFGDDGKLTDQQYGVLVGAAILVNKGGVDVPFSPAALRHRRSSEPE